MMNNYGRCLEEIFESALLNDMNFFWEPNPVPGNPMRFNRGRSKFECRKEIKDEQSVKNEGITMEDRRLVCDTEQRDVVKAPVSVEQIRGWTQCQVALSSAFNGVRQEARLNLHVMTQGRSRMR